MLAAALLLGIVLATIAGTYNRWLGGGSATTEQPDAVAEFRKIGQHFLQDSLLHITGVIRLYDGEQPGRVREQNSFQLLRDGADSYNRLGYMQSFVSNGLMVQLDTVNQLMVIGDAPEQAGATLGLQQSTGMLFNDSTAFAATGTVSGDAKERTLTLRSDLRPEISSYQLTYDPATYRMKRAVIEWRKEEAVPDTADRRKVWITQIDYSYQPVATVKVSEMMKRVIVQTRDTILPTDRYSDFQLHITKP